jgi:ubiquinone/menaquinone biosynthesis C-methylase UbiE
MLDLNVGVGAHTDAIATKIVFNALNIDVYRDPTVNVVCDVQHLPFKAGAFQDVYCFHVLEHLSKPALALKELVRVAKRLVELEVPHYLSRMAKSEKHKKGDVALFHVCSFRCSWFNSCLRNYVRSVKVLYQFPRDLHIHVCVYVEETKRRGMLYYD